MEAIDEVRSKLPEAAKDLKLNLQSVLSDSSLSESQRWGVAVASALSAGSAELRDAILSDAARFMDDDGVDDARAAAALMGMNNVYYRFRHWMDKEAYQKTPARLRMQRIVRPKTSKGDFELYSLAASAIEGCEMCVKSHEDSVTKEGLSEENVHDAVRIAATIRGVAVALQGL